MKCLLLFLVPCAVMASALPPTPFPVFLKAGFSSVLEFDQAPVRVVLGDSQSFQVERVDKSLVVRTLTPYATSNMFVYFRGGAPRLFVLTASEDANPTYYKRFETPKPPQPPAKPNSYRRGPGRGAGARILRRQFDAKKDYLIVSFELSADSKEVLRPNWNRIRLTYKGKALAPYKLWAQRQEVQRDSRVNVRMVFAKPNLPRNLLGVGLVIPLQGKTSAISIPVKGAL